MQIERRAAGVLALVLLVGGTAAGGSITAGTIHEGAGTPGPRCFECRSQTEGEGEGEPAFRDASGVAPSIARWLRHLAPLLAVVAIAASVEAGHEQRTSAVDSEPPAARGVWFGTKYEAPDLEQAAVYCKGVFAGIGYRAPTP